MSLQVLPKIIRGSGIVVFNGIVDYWKGELSVKLARRTEDIDSDTFGPVDTRAIGTAAVDITYTPVGMIKNFAKHFPYGPSNLVAASSVGKSMFGPNPIS